METSKKITLDWVDGLKVFAILGILLNHSVESFAFFPWFSNPSYNWPPLSERLQDLFPSSGNIFSNLVIFLGWLGDMGPGVFIMLSGLTLTLSAYRKKRGILDFYKQRALRIYPLYISIHLIILLLVVFIFGWNINILSLKNIFSLGGIRFIDSLFFYINPSWWFIWLILQMYFVFPFLLLLLQKRGIKVFLLVTLIITLVSRLAGLLGVTYSNSLYYWMTGIFAGTRLFEFSAGMFIGLMIYEQNKKFNLLIADKTKIFFYSLVVYLCGFICSLTYAGSLISNILLTIGLSGIFYALYFVLCSSDNQIKKTVSFLGKNSFSVFLIHQPLMMYASSVFDKGNLVIALLFIVLISFFAGYYIEKTVNAGTPYFLVMVEKIREYLAGKIHAGYILFLLLAVSLYSFLLPFIDIRFGIKRYSMQLVLLLILFLIYIFREKNNFHRNFLISRFFDITFFISMIYLVLTLNWQPLYWIFVLLGFFLAVITLRLNYFVAVCLTFLIILGSVLGTESFLKYNKPVEVMQWGELPALQIDEKTGYSLIPSKTTHLKYNNYDYIVRTNSLGLASPEINLDKTPDEFRIFVIGDAFTMPEGMENEASYPYLLEQDLRKNYPDRKINVINGGVTGFGPNEFYAQLNKYIDTIRPDLVINQFFVNEFSEVNSPLHSRNYDIGIDLNVSTRDYYFRNTQIPVHYLRNIQMCFNYEDSFYKYRKSLLYLYEKNSPLYSDTVIVKLDEYLQRAKVLCEENNSDLMIMFVPGQIAVSRPSDIAYFPGSLDIYDTLIYSFDKPNRIIREMCTANKLRFLDLTEALINHPVQPVYFPESWHWNKEGHKMVAGVLLNNLLEIINNKDDD